MDKYFQAESYLNQGLIRPTVPDKPNKFTNREWMLKFLDDLGHPEKHYPAVHIAGTSGKGSTAVMIAEILRAAGYRVGLHTSPYLQVATEKLWVDGKYASADEFIELIEWIRPICEKWRGPEVPLHGLASVGICLEYFRRKKIDIAVIETGVGGRDDTTNVLQTILSIITPIDIDHQKTLGNTIEEIAAHKAGIIKQQKPVVAVKGNGAEIIRCVAEKSGSQITWITDPDININDSNLPGVFQNINRAIAKSAACILNDLGFKIGIENVSAGLKSARIPGRYEIVTEAPKIILDGAHNRHKLSNLLKEFDNKNISIIFGTLESKADKELAKLLNKPNFELILTKPSVYGKNPFDPEIFIKDLKLSQPKIIEDPSEALNYAVNNSSNNTNILVTGSLYLIGHLRDHFYPRNSILENRTSWPAQEKSIAF